MQLCYQMENSCTTNVLNVRITAVPKSLLKASRVEKLDSNACVTKKGFKVCSCSPELDEWMDGG